MFDPSPIFCWPDALETSHPQGNPSTISKTLHVSSSYLCMCMCILYIYIFINMEINLLIDIRSTITYVDTHAHTHTIYIYISWCVYIHIIYRISKRYRLPVITFGFHRSIGSRLLSLPEACPTSSATTRVSAAWRTTGATGASRYGALAKCRSKAWMGAMVGTYGVIIYF